MVGSGPDYTVYIARGGKRQTGQLLPLSAKRWLEASGYPDAPAPRIERDSLGKPFFPEYPGLYCSVTHSGEWWLCAVGTRPVGLDLQRHAGGARAKEISARFFHPEEDAFLKETGFADFFALWAAKESYLKYTGQGLSGGLSRFSVAGPEGMRRQTEGVSLYPLPFCAGYSLCLCAKEAGKIDFVYLEE